MMGTKRLLLDKNQLSLTIDRLCLELLQEHDEDFSKTVLLGMQPRGVILLERVRHRLKALAGGLEIPHGVIDVTFHRDDIRVGQTKVLAQPKTTSVPFDMSQKRVVLIDDVLFTGRTVRAALEAMLSFGRPDKVELLVLIDRLCSRDLPIEAHYVGRYVNTFRNQHVKVALTQQKEKQDAVWIVAQDG